MVSCGGGVIFSKELGEEGGGLWGRVRSRSESYHGGALGYLEMKGRIWGIVEE